MSQLSLLMQLKLQRKLQKSQSQLPISESLDSLGTEEEELEEELEDEFGLGETLEGEDGQPSELAKALASLVLLHFFYFTGFRQVKGQSRQFYDLRRSRFIKQFFPVPPGKETFPLFPTSNLVSAYPLGIVCECGRVFSKESFGVVPSCLSCYGMGRPPTYWYSELIGHFDILNVPRVWNEWAKSVAIQLEAQRKFNLKSNQNRVTDFGETIHGTQTD